MYTFCHATIRVNADSVEHTPQCVHTDTQALAHTNTHLHYESVNHGPDLVL